MQLTKNIPFVKSMLAGCIILKQCIGTEDIEWEEDTTGSEQNPVIRFFNKSDHLLGFWRLMVQLTVRITITYAKILYDRQSYCGGIIQGVPLANEPGISLKILTPMKILQRNCLNANGGHFQHML